MSDIPSGYRVRGASDLPAGYRVRSSPTPQAGLADEKGGFTSFLNQGISSALGAPVDLVNVGLGAIGVPVSDEPFGGSTSIARGMGQLGIRSAPQGATPETIPEYIGRGLGGAAGALPAGGGIIGVASTATSPVVRGAAQTLSRPFIATPKRALAAEALAGAGSGLGESAANEIAPGNLGAQLAGSLVGGITGGMLPAAINRFSPTRMATNFAASQLAPFTERGALERARSRIDGLVGDKDAARRALDGLGLSDLSPAARTGEPALMALEQSVRRKYPELNDAMRAQERVAAGQLTDIAEGIAPNATPAEARAALSERVSGLVSRMDERGQQAITQAENRIAQLSPDMRQAQSSVIVREELEGAYKAARDEERQLWAQIPREVSVSTGNSKSAVDGIYQDTPEALHDNISPKAMKYLGPNGRFRGNVPVKELHGLYSALREDARVARAAGELNRARIDGVIADAIMQDIDASPIAGGPMREALAFSRQFNQRFTQGDVGRILGTDRVGGDRIAPELTLDRTVGRAGISGGLSVDQLRNATGNDIPALNDYVMGQFTDRMVRDNRISVPRAETYLARNHELLTRLPGVRNQITGAMDQQAAAQGTASRMQSRMADVSAGPAATFANARQAAEVDAILRSSDPARYARQAMMQAKDKGDGVRRAFINDLFARSRDVDPSGEMVTSGRRMIARLNDPIYRNALSGVMTRPEVSRLDRIANEFSRLEAMRSDIGSRGTVGATGAIMGDTPNTLITTPIRVIAARLGAKAGAGTSGASLQTSGMFTRAANRVLSRLTNDQAEALIVKAINNKETFDLLMWPIERMSKQRESRLIETLTGIMGASAASIDGIRESGRSNILPHN